MLISEIYAYWESYMPLLAPGNINRIVNFSRDSLIISLYDPEGQD